MHLLFSPEKMYITEAHIAQQWSAGQHHDLKATSSGQEVHRDSFGKLGKINIMWMFTAYVFSHPSSVTISPHALFVFQMLVVETIVVVEHHI